MSSELFDGSCGLEVVETDRPVCRRPAVTEAPEK